MSDDVLAGNLSSVSSVYQAANGEFFLTGGGHNVLEYAQGKLKPSDESIANLKENLAFRRRRATELGVPFVHIVAPEKYRVMPDGFPVQNPSSLAEAYRAGGCDFIYPVEELKDHDGKGRSYYYADTHWAPHGLRRITTLVAKAAGLPPELVKRGDDQITADIRPAEAPYFGDLGKKFNPPFGEEADILKPSHPTGIFDNGLAHLVDNPVNDGRMIVLISHCTFAADKYLLIFGDSYLHHCLPYFAYFFKRVIYCRTRFWHEEMVTSVQPDMIVTEMAERYLSFVNPDSVAPPFLTIPWLLQRPTNPTPDAAKVIARVLSGRRKAAVELFPPK